MNRKTTGRVVLLSLAAVGVVVAIAVILVFNYFAPVAPTQVDRALEAADGWQAGSKALATGQFVSADGVHVVTGTLSVYRGKSGLILRFEDYEATNGPAVYAFVSSSPDAQFDEATATRVLLAGGEEDGMATLRGNFSASLDPSIELESIKSLIVRCDRLGVSFGSAQLALEEPGH